MFSIVQESPPSDLLIVHSHHHSEKALTHLVIQELRSLCPLLLEQYRLIISYLPNLMDSVTISDEMPTSPLQTTSYQMTTIPLIYTNYFRPNCIPKKDINYSSDELIRLSEDPYEFYEEIDAYKDMNNGFPFDQNLLVLSLCTCLKMSPVLREFVSKSSLDQFSEMRHNKERPLTLLTVGMGGGYHEIAYAIVPFAQAGFSKMNVVCIDQDPMIVFIINAMTDFCKNKLPQCDIRFYKFSHIEDYAFAAQYVTFLRPDFLLLLDLTDHEYNIGNETFRDYSFSFLQKEELLSPGTVIVYSTYTIALVQVIRTAICCTYQNMSGHLNNIVPRKEFMEILKGYPRQPLHTWQVCKRQQTINVGTLHHLIVQSI